VGEISGLFKAQTRSPPIMDENASTLSVTPGLADAGLTEAGRAALAEAGALARQAPAPATLRAYRSD
jgi:hypothetical protein